MKILFGILMIFGGIALGFYVGGWICFIGGIAGLITEVKAEQIDAMKIAINIGKIIFSGFAGWLSAIILIIPGYVTIFNN